MVVQTGFSALIAVARIWSLAGEPRSCDPAEWQQNKTKQNKTKQKAVRSCSPWCMLCSPFSGFSGCPWSGFYILVSRACHRDAAGSHLSPACLDVQNQKTLCSAWFIFTSVWPDQAPIIQVSLRCRILKAAHSATCFRSHTSLFC